MFNEFEGDERERAAKLKERLWLLKRAREDGFFDEEGTEEVTVMAAGINPCDLGYSAFTGEDTETPYEQWRAQQRPRGVTAPPLKDANGNVRFDKYNRPLKDKRGSMECKKCQGLGSLEPMYGDSAMLDRCPVCGGSGRTSTRLWE